MNRKTRNATAAAVITGALAQPLYAQEPREPQSQTGPKITQEFMVSSNPKERGMSRTIGVYERDGYEAFGLLDVALRRAESPDYFLILSGHRKVGKGAELVFETVKAKGKPADFGIGMGYDFPLPDKYRFNVHALPLNMESGGIARRSELAMFGGAKLKKGYYVDGRMQLTFPYGERTEYTGEIAAGKKLSDRFALQGTFARNKRGSAVRADLKYGVLGK